MQTIATQFFGATATKPSRVKATASGGGGRITIPWSYYELSAGDTTQGNHEAAALALMIKLDWTGKMIGGHTPDGLVFVFTPDSRSNTPSIAIERQG